MWIKKINIGFDAWCKIIISILLAKFAYNIVWYNSVENFLQVFSILIFIFVILNMSRILKFFWGPKGFEIELAKIEATKEEILEIQNDIKDVYKEMLHLNIALIESTKRLTWDGPPDYDQLISIINTNCKKLGLTSAEIDYVFRHKSSWEEEDKKTLNS
jgi:hypothetical protein